MPTGALRVHAVLFAVQLAFASGALAGKIALHREGVDPTALAFIRASAGALASLLAERLTRKGPVEPLPRLPMIAFAFLGVVINQAFFLHGLRRGTATSAALLSATIPVFTAGLGIAVGLERPRMRTWLGIGIATAGVLGLTGVRDISLGNLLVTINSLSYAAYLVAVGRWVRRHGALRVVGAAFAWGALVLAIPGIPSLVHHAREFTSRGWLLVLWFVMVPTIFAYLANAWALGRARPSMVAAYIYLQPFLVIAVAGSILGERLDPKTVFAGLAILLGLGIVVFRHKKDDAPGEEGAVDDQGVRPDQASTVRSDHASK